MGSGYQFHLIAISFLFLVTGNFTYADTVGDTSGVQTGVILEKLNGDRESTILEKVEEQARPGRRIGRKLVGGAVLCAMSATVGFGLGAAVDDHNCWDDDADEIFCIEDGAVLGAFIGCAVGPAIGVSAMDPYDRFAYSLAGSVGGALLGRELVGALSSLELITFENLYLYPILIFGSSLALATVGSEWSRDPLKARPRQAQSHPIFTIWFEPDLTKGLSATVNLRF